MVPCEVSAVVRIGLAIAKGVDVMRVTSGMQSDREPESWTAVVLGVLPFLLPMLVFLGPLMEAVYAALGWESSQTKIAGSLVAIGLALFVLGALLAGWLSGFPRWSYPYLGLVVFVGLILLNSSTPGLWLFGYDRGREVWGWLAWIPLLVVAATAVIVLLVSRPVERQFRLLTNMWQDWTLLSFALYGMFILGPLLTGDEIDSPWKRPVAVVGGLLLALGAAAYMRAGTKKRRSLALFCGFTLAFNLVVGFSTYYWQTQSDMGIAYYTPYTVTDTIAFQARLWLYFAAFLFSPALIGLLQRSTQRLRPA